MLSRQHTEYCSVFFSENQLDITSNRDRMKYKILLSGNNKEIASLLSAEMTQLGKD